MKLFINKKFHLNSEINALSYVCHVYKMITNENSGDLCLFFSMKYRSKMNEDFVYKKN